MSVGTADAYRLDLLGRFYNPSSRAFLESVGVAAGDAVVDIGCGHGALTGWLADRVGPSGEVFALDNSPAQLAIARDNLKQYSNINYCESSLEDATRHNIRADWVYSRFFLMHVADPLKALEAMVRMLKPQARVLLELADVGTLRFTPGNAASDLWRPWWYAVGKKRDASYDVTDHIEDLFNRAGLLPERMDRFQPVSTNRAAKMLHALGFEQSASDYVDRCGVDIDDVKAHRAYLESVLDDPTVAINLFQNTQYVARLQ